MAKIMDKLIKRRIDKLIKKREASDIKNTKAIVALAKAAINYTKAHDENVEIQRSIASLVWKNEEKQADDDTKEALGIKD